MGVVDPILRLRPEDPIVAVAADDDYAMPLAVSIRSVIDRLSPERRLGIVVLDGGIRPANRERVLRSWPADRVEVAWFTPDASVFDDAPTWRWVNRVMYYRLLLPQLLPEAIAKILYLDVDVLALADVSALWDEPLGDVALRATQDPTSPYMDAERAMPAGWVQPAEGFTPQPLPNYDLHRLEPDTPYLNSGVLMMNLDWWRRHDVTRRLLECLLENAGQIEAPDQYALNVVLHGAWAPMDPGWNALAVLHRRGSWRETHYDEATFRRLLDVPYILHWAGVQKPWNGLGAVPREELFHRTRAKTAWAGWRGQQRLLGFRLARTRKRTRRRARHALRDLRRATRQPRKKAAAAAARLARVGVRGGRWARQRLQGPREGARPAFLVGCGRSGTNMLVDRLSRTWELDPVNEYDPAAFHEWWLRDLDSVAAVAQRSRARTVLFKPILDTPRVPQLLERFPEGRVLFAVRDWAAVVRSALALFGPENWPGRVAGWMSDDFAEFGAPLPANARERVRSLWRADLDPASATALYWLFYTGLYCDQGLDSDPRVRLVHYQLVLEQPEAQLREVCDFLGIGYRARMSPGVEPRNRHTSESLGVEPSIAEACDALYARLADADASSSAASNASRNEV